MYAGPGLYIVALVLGVAGGFLGRWSPPSGRNAVILGLIPYFGFALGRTFC